MINPDFSDYTWKNPASTCPNIAGSGTAPGMGIGNVVNWDESHGSVNAPNPSGSTYPNARWIVADRGPSTAGASEGFVGGYPFRPGREYVVSIHTSGFTANGLRVAIGKGAKPHNPNCEILSCNSESMNGIKPGTPALTYTYYWPGRTFGDEEVYFIFTPTSNYDWVWLYATHEDYGSSCETVGGMIVSVDVKPVCNEDVLTLSAPTVPENNYGGYAYINVGSSFGSGTTPTTITAPTLLEATRVITMAPGFVAAPTSGEFVANINYSSCAYTDIPTAGRPAPGDIILETGEITSVSKMSIPTVEYNKKKYLQHQNGTWEELLLEQINETSINIYPNPSSNHLLTIENNLNSSISFETYDIGGRCIDKGTISSRNKKGLNYSLMPPGIYYIKTITPEGVRTEKIVLQ